MSKAINELPDNQIPMYEHLYGKQVSMNDRFESIHIWSEELAIKNNGKWKPEEAPAPNAPVQEEKTLGDIFNTLDGIVGNFIGNTDIPTDKENILNLKEGEKYIVPESDYGKCEIWLINEIYFLFEIPEFGGQPHYSGAYSKHNIDAMIEQYNSWT